ncbi:MAG: hypothetical protein HY606_09205, partial [Planctomycetes bacterium]|nr:hypothetical protein [Planctomycetota bacterium]
MSKNLVVRIVLVLSVMTVVTGAIFMVSKSMNNPASNDENSQNESIIISDSNTSVSNTASDSTQKNVKQTVKTMEIDSLLLEQKYDDVRNILDALDDNSRMMTILTSQMGLINSSELLLRSEKDYKIYTTQEGDSFIKIANKFQKELQMPISYGSIKLFNQIND